MFLTEGVRLDRGLRMARIARVAASGYPHHVTQRGVHLNAHREKLVVCPRIPNSPQSTPRTMEVERRRWALIGRYFKDRGFTVGLGEPPRIKRPRVSLPTTSIPSRGPVPVNERNRRTVSMGKVGSSTRHRVRKIAFSRPCQSYVRSSRLRTASICISLAL